MDLDHYLALFGEDASWVEAQIKAFWDRAYAEAGDDDPYPRMDCGRIARKGVQEQEVEYEATRSCCGQVDVEFGPSPLGHTYMYGFNYGH